MTKLRMMFGVLGALLTAGAVGQTNAAPVILGEYYEESVTNGVYSPVPSGKILMVKRVFCRYITAGSIVFVRLTVSGNVVRRVDFAATNGGGNIYLASVETDFLVYAGKVPVLDYGFTGTAPTTVDCTIIGKLVPVSSQTGFFD